MLKKVLPAILLLITTIAVIHYTYKNTRTEDTTHTAPVEVTDADNSSAANPEWKEYDNLDFGYHIEYPATATVNFPSGHSDLVPKPLQQMSIYLGDAANMSVTVYGYADATFNQKEAVTENPDYQKLLIRGKDAWQRINDNEGQWFAIETLLFGKEYIYHISFSNNTKDQAKIDQVNNIIQSFTFSK